MDEGLCVFSAVIAKAGTNPYVEVPDGFGVCLGKKGRIPVVGTLNGIPIRATLMPVLGGGHRLYVNLDMRRRANVNVGDDVRIALKVDTKPRAVPVPKELAEALQRDERARVAFGRLKPSRQREILAYLNYLKKPESVKRNVDRVLRILVGQENSANAID